MEWDPVLNEEVLNWATAEPFSVAAAKDVVPSRKVTDPVGTVVFPVGPATVAVKVTDWPCPDGFGEDVRVIVDINSPVAFTIWVMRFDVDP